MPHVSPARARLARLVQLPYVHVAGVQFNPTQLTPRIRTRVIRFLTIGAAVGRGEAAEVAAVLDSHFDLGLRHVYNSYVHIDYARRQLTDDQKQRMVEVLNAAAAAQMMGARAAEVNHLQLQHRANVDLLLKGHSTDIPHRTWLYVADTAFIEQLLTVACETDPPTVTARRRAVIDRLTGTAPFTIPVSL